MRDKLKISTQRLASTLVGETTQLFCFCYAIRKMEVAIFYFVFPTPKPPPNSLLTVIYLYPKFRKELHHAIV